MRSNTQQACSHRAAVTVVVLALCAAWGASSGCSPKDDSGTADTRSWDKDAFVPEGEIHAVDRFTEAQSARGANADAMLYPRHFDGGELNALGMSKVHLMLQKNPAGAPLAVYLNTGEDDELLDARREAVGKYVASTEYTATALDIRSGPNLDARAPSAAGIASLSRTDTARSSRSGSSPAAGDGTTAGSSIGSGASSGTSR